MKNIASFFKLGIKHINSMLVEELYLRTGYDMTKPTSFYGLINEHCDARCKHCGYWRRKEYRKEITIEQWKKALLSIKEFVGTYFINFSGGEPFLKKGFIELLDFCYKNGIRAGVTTNGAWLTKDKVKGIVATRPFNINISCDAPNAEIHDYFRGYPGLFDKICRGIGLLREEQAVQGIEFPIVIKPTICSLNFRLLPELVDWVKEINATAINFQPLSRWTKETYDELWIEEKDLPDLGKIIERLIQIRREGAPIMNSEENLRLITSHFREEKAPLESMPCRIGLHNFFIHADGDVFLCFPHFPAVGNVTKQSARDIWYGEEASEIRKQTIECRKLCLSACLSRKSLLHKIRTSLRLLKS